MRILFGLLSFSLAVFLPLGAIAEDLPGPVRRASDSTVLIIKHDFKKKMAFFANGFFSGRNLKVITNRHAVEANSTTEIITAKNQRLAIGKIIYEDVECDLITLSTNIKRGEAWPLKFREELPEKGDGIYVVERDKDFKVKITRGIIIFVGKIPEFGGEVIQISVPITPGSSGSPVIDKNGEVVGIVSFKLTREDKKDRSFAVAGPHLLKIGVQKKMSLSERFEEWIQIFREEFLNY